MGKNNGITVTLVIASILMIAVSTYMVVTYSTGILNAAVDFTTTEHLNKLDACGITYPAEILKLKADVPGLLLPAIYVGLPGILIVLSVLMFIAGYYYANGKEGRSSSETTTTTSTPNRSGSSGRYQPGRHVEQTRTQKTSRSEGN